MGSFLVISIITLVLIGAVCLCHYEILRGVWNVLPRLTAHPYLRVIAIVAAVFSAHFAAIWLFAAAYYLLEHYTSLGSLAIINGQHFEGAFDRVLDALYFSAATYSSLGLGDVVPTGNLRMVAGAEVLTGLIMIGWTISFSYLVMEKFWELPHRKRRKGTRPRT